MKRAANPTPPWPTKLAHVALLLAIALVIARATIIQILREPQLMTPGAEAVPRIAGPTTALILDLLMCVPALLTLTRRLIDREYVLRCRTSSLFFGAFAIWAGVSAFWSPDKFATVVTSADLIGSAALLWAMIQLVRSWIELRLVAAACCGILQIYIANGILYEAFDLPDNISYFEQHKSEILVQRNWEPGSYAAMRFEQKVRSGELAGFNTSPNTFAAAVVMLGVIVAGALLQRLSDRDEPGWSAAIIAILIGAIGALWFTYSKTALITPFIAVALIALAPYVARNRRRAYLTCACAAVVIAVAIIGYGLAFNRLPSRSLSFRWQYWRGAAKIFEQRPLLGVSWSNFGAHYLGVRQPIAPEEVKDPHNLIVRAFVELGLIGGALMLAWLARLAWELIAHPAGLPLQWQAKPPDPRSTARTISLVCILALLLNIASSVDFTLNYPGRAWLIVYEIMRRLLFTGVLLLACAVTCLESTKRPTMDDRPAPWLARAMIAALAVFLIHNLVDFSLFEPGPMSIFAMVSGTAIGIRASTDNPRTKSRVGPIIAFTIAAMTWLAAALGVVLPVASAERKSQFADDMLRDNQPLSAARALNDAFGTLWITNPDYAYRTAIALQYARLSADQTRPMLDAAVRANPMSVLYHRNRAQMELRQPQPDAARIIEDYERAIALDPNEVSAHVDFADALARLGQSQRAIAEYRAALRYDGLLERDEPKRLPPDKVNQINRRISELGG